jgi:predicted nucleic acid-binding protein
MKTHDIFVDTSALHAMLVSNDPFHPATIAFIRELQRDRRQLITTDYVIDETVTLLKTRRVPSRIGKLFELLDQSTHLSIEWIGEERFAGARDLVLKHADHAYSFTDCTSFVVMRELDITDALTVDRHFREAGFRPLLAPR